MLNKLIIIGAGGFGREVAWLTERINEVKTTWDILGFLDDDPDMQDETPGGYPVLGGVDKWAEYKDAYFVCAVGNSSVRKKIISKLEGAAFATLIDPSVIMSKHVSVGDGSIICAGTIVTVNIKIGKHNIINLDCTVGHDAILHDFVTLYPSVNISGMTEIKECCEIGTGAQVLQMQSICENCKIGAGAVVVKNITKSGTYIGVPAKNLGGGVTFSYLSVSTSSLGRCAA